MKLNKLLLTTVLTSVLLNAVEMPPMPPSVPHLKVKKQNTKDKNMFPSSCKMLPPMIFNLPPPMENELIKCKNELHIPSKKLVEKQLSKYLKKKVFVTKVEIVKNFTELYKISYKGGVILTNKSVSAFIK